MKITTLFYLAMCLLLLAGCASSYKTYNPDKKFAKIELQQEYQLLRNILQSKHPSLYWYTSKDSMDFYLDSLYRSIPDSMTELQFGWKIIAPLTQKIHCGHTSFSLSNNWYRFMKNKRIPSFPLFVKVWGDTMMVTGNLLKNDSLIKRGSYIKSINGINSSDLLQRMFQYLPTDGYANNVNFIRLSSNFPYFHRNIFGLYKNYKVVFADSAGTENTAVLPLWMPPVDSSKKQSPPTAAAKISRKKIKQQRRLNYRNIVWDTAAGTAIITLNTFSTGGGRHLRHFINSSFKKIKRWQCNSLVLDIRNNGGGEINMSTLLTRYIRKTSFKVADSAYTVAKSLAPYTRYVKQGMLTNWGNFFLTKKRQDGNYHFGFYERKTYRPKQKNHFGGDVYVLINGPTFSASTLFANAIKGQDNVLLVGEDAGGGWHGNNGIMIPDIILPLTKLRVRLPLFRIVQYNHVPKNGLGVTPDVYIPPLSEAVKLGIDKKMEWVQQQAGKKKQR
jgi:hypothetical protein